MISREKIVDWARELKLIRNFPNETEKFLIFFKYLESIGLIYPLKITQKKSKFDEQIEYEREIIHIEKLSEDFVDQVVHYYHPFQFFQFIAYLFAFKSYQSIKESRFYYFLRKKLVVIHENDEKKRIIVIKKIEKEERKWIGVTNRAMFRGFNKNVDRSKKFTKKEKKEKKKQNLKNLRELNNKLKTYKDFFYPKLIGAHFLTKDLLKVWIKLDSIIYYPDYIITPTSIRVSYMHPKIFSHEEEKRHGNLLKFRKWQESMIKNCSNFFTMKDKATLKNFLFDIDRVFSRDYNNIIDGLDNWIDLLDLIAIQKKEKITGRTNIAINLLSIKRFLGLISWALLNYNIQLWPKNQEKKQPYYFMSGEKDSLEYRKSILSEFRLFTTIPFILGVEGETEKKLIESYFENKPMYIIIDVENIRGGGNTIYYSKLIKDIKEREYYLFLDYENQKNYEEKFKMILDGGVFFFPDFVTENFNVEQILKCYSCWITDLGGNLNKEDKHALNQKLTESKIQSDALIRASKKEGTAKGFEEILIDFTKVNYSNLILHNFPEFKIDKQTQYLSYKKLKQKFKEIFTERYLIEIIKTSLKDDPERNIIKFEFENKLEPFYKKINNVIYRNMNYPNI